MPESPLRVYLIAGEASGDLLGAGLMAALRDLSDRPVTFHGIGGERMVGQGLASRFPMAEISLMGFAEIVPHIRRLKRRIRETVADIERVQPDIVVTIDSPGFNFRVVRALRKRGRVCPRLVHYVAPSVWAYKPGRAKKTAALFDHLLCLFPFEPPYFEREGLPATFVGHPVADAPITNPPITNHQSPTLCLLPGSREGELRRHLPLYRETLARLASSLPEMRVLIPVPPALEGRVRENIRGWPGAPEVIAGDREKQDAFAACDVALAKSGTVSLELARVGLPMVTTYRAHPASAWLVRRMLRTPYVNLVNILLGREAVPEYLQEKATPKNLAAALHALLTSHQQQETQHRAFADALALLHPPGQNTASEVAATAVLSVVAEKS